MPDPSVLSADGLPLFAGGAYSELLAGLNVLPWRGRVVEANGQWLESEGPIADIGECCEVRSRAGGPPRPGEVVGFHEQRTLVMLLEPDAALRYGDELIGLGEQPSIGVGAGLLGRVIDARGRPIDGQGMVRAETRAVIRSHAPGPFARLPILAPYTTGVRAIDAMLSIGQGQRVGIFGGSGVGKSTLMGMLSRVSESQITVIALVGERGREVLDFVENSLGPGGLAHSVLVVATSDQSPLLKMRAAESATTIAEYFQAQGRDVLLIIDSLTRYAMAAREIGLANGEPPTSKGYTPSVFSRLARLVERAGRFRRHLHGTDGGRRPPGPHRRCCPLLRGWPYHAVAADGPGRVVSADRCAGFDQPLDAGDRHPPARCMRGQGAPSARCLCCFGGPDSHWRL